MENIDRSFHKGHHVEWLNFFSVLLMDTEVRRRLAEIIKKARGKRSQRDFAKALGVSQAAVLSWEKMESFPGTDSMKAIATSVSMSLDELLLYLEGETAQVNRVPAPKVAEDALSFIEHLNREEQIRLIKLLVDKVTSKE
ncbi:helix-turn-helix domain-containing protein [Aetokthonos hydrillicola Thurmond2011]|jgi:transcriptional regulator with XRE-family HTH domain|uniref:Helix-turn-helix domain-containing protein n=1 Tax=Aetokthonos hydrillicola Thurmond2011 TaxID=2712845 RepID=A0AAP5I1R5_9CYAN|nr:helix-turn-helix transcriptional regulator [Aetokthonos hydrillicola]MBO3462874.1 helix-turn-helix transcriptional regulator [Aetokthonos hydrillicola CCALA 1050]MDR9893219.1 helix-turn-helix domain-containing protein [Aetokthonos hydrillicola Thurmond2011]